MQINRTRVLQIMGLTILTVVTIVPMGKDIPAWPRLTEQERLMEYAYKNMGETEVAQEIRASSSSSSATTEVAQAETTAVSAKAEVTTSRKVPAKRKVIAATPEPAEEEQEPFVAPSHYMLRNRGIIRELAQIDREEPVPREE